MATQGSTNPFYTTPAWRALRDAFRSDWLRAGRPCGYCGKPLQKTDSVAVDHIQAIRLRPDLAMNLSNLRCVHTACNTKARHSEGKPAVGLDGYPEGW